MLWIPGPTEVRPEVLAELSRPTIGHRTPGMAELHERIDPPLAHAFGLGAGSTAQVAVHSTSGTGMMEASLRGAGDRVLSVVNGAFSKRFAQVAESLGKEVHVLASPSSAPLSATSSEPAASLTAASSWILSARSRVTSTARLR
jgi:aspartate aminotransferase-like enzyme